MKLSIYMIEWLVYIYSVLSMIGFIGLLTDRACKLWGFPGSELGIAEFFDRHRSLYILAPLGSLTLLVRARGGFIRSLNTEKGSELVFAWISAIGAAIFAVLILTYLGWYLFGRTQQRQT